MIMWERPLCRDSRDTKVPPTLEMINRFPILIGFASPRSNRCSQLRGKASIRPPNSLSSAAESLRERHTISSSRRLLRGSAYDHELAASARLKEVFVRFNPMQFGSFAPEIHGRSYSF